jgi:hypothetical protein
VAVTRPRVGGIVSATKAPALEAKGRSSSGTILSDELKSRYFLQRSATPLPGFEEALHRLPGLRCTNGHIFGPQAVSRPKAAGQELFKINRILKERLLLPPLRARTADHVLFELSQEQLKIHDARTLAEGRIPAAAAAAWPNDRKTPNVRLIWLGAMGGRGGRL